MSNKLPCCSVLHASDLPAFPLLQCTHSTPAAHPQEIPTATSLVAAFNRDLLSRCVANYTAAMGALALPVEEEQLEREDITAKAIAVEVGRVDVSAVCLCVQLVKDNGPLFSLLAQP